MSVSELKFTDQHYAEIGKIIIFFQKLEFKINCLLGILLNTHFLSSHSCRLNALFAEVGFNSKLTTLQSILKDIKSFEDVKDLFPPNHHSHKEIILEDIKALVKILEDVKRSASIRNRYAHSQWIDGGMCGPIGTVGRYKITAKGKTVKSEFVFESLSDLEEKSIFIQKTWSALMENSQAFESLAIDVSKINIKV